MRHPGELLFRVGHVSSQNSDMAINQFLREVEWDPLDFLVVDLSPRTGDEGSRRRIGEGRAEDEQRCPIHVQNAINR